MSAKRDVKPQELEDCSCGSRDLVMHKSLAGDLTLYWVRCARCGTQTRKNELLEDVVGAWNDGEVQPLHAALTVSPEPQPAPALER